MGTIKKIKLLVTDFIRLFEMGKRFLLDLPPEIHKHIFHYCEKSDIINLTCCSNEYHNVFTFYLFTGLSFRWDDLVNPSSPKLSLVRRKSEYLKFTKSLTFDGNDGDVNQKIPAWHLISKNCIQILNFCPNLRTMFVACINGITLKRILRATPNIQTLSLAKLSDTHFLCWEELVKLCYLEKLLLLKCNISDAAINIIAKHTKLEFLGLFSCQGLTRNGLQRIGDMVQLKEFMMLCCDNDDVDLYWLTKLRKLEALTLNSLK